jgi:hypothetical protein
MKKNSRIDKEDILKEDINKKEYSEEYSYADAPKERGFVHPQIAKVLTLTDEEKVELSRYPEHAIIKGIEDCIWYTKQVGTKITNLGGLIRSRIQHYSDGGATGASKKKNNRS